jgi:hypothetical protein
VWLVDSYASTVFDSITTVKQFRFERHYPGQSIIMGNHYLAKGFGIVWFNFEPGIFCYLSGAMIDSTKYEL